MMWPAAKALMARDLLLLWRRRGDALQPALFARLVVVLFALVGEMAKPKRFAGIFSAAPTIALANLTVTALTAGSKDFPAYGLGMLAGTAGFLAYGLVCPVLIDRLGALRGSALSFAAWLAAAGPVFLLVAR
jgi:uncharacterized membrane protein (GlpM family)